MTIQRFLGAIILLFITFSAIFFTVNKFKSEVVNVSASPTPFPSALEFIFSASTTPVVQQQNQKSQQAEPQALIQPQPTPRPYFINKNVGKFPGILTEDSLKEKKVVVQTNKGTFEIEIFTDVPIASSNFLILADRGFYDGLKFHRVEDWVVQGGDPLGNGTGGPGYLFADEAVSRAYVKGIVAMANAGPNTNGSQFFVLKTDYQLAPNYTIFGKVITAMEVVEKISVGDVMQKVTIQNLH